jgi:hypothetical protein
MSIEAVMDRVNLEEEPGSALEYIQDVYRGRRPAEPWRFRAAVAALPFEAPKLSAMAITSMDEHSFAAALERAITRANGARSPAAGKVIEHQPNGSVEHRPEGRRRVS